jgi:hypothetical protein
MEQSPSWEANRFAASQEIPRILFFFYFELWHPRCVLDQSIQGSNKQS